MSTEVIFAALIFAVHSSMAGVSFAESDEWLELGV